VSSTTQKIQTTLDLEPWPALTESSNPLVSRIRVVSTLLDQSVQLRDQKVLRAKTISELMNLPKCQPLLIPNQKHTNRVVQALHCDSEGIWYNEEDDISTKIEADGIWTTQEGITLGVRTADCVPIIIFSDSEPFIAALHSGWKGTKSRILDQGIQKAIELGIPVSSLRVWIGPRISGEVYEVSSELAEDFVETFPQFSDFRDGRYIDLGMINKQICLEAGMNPKQVFVSQYCTYKNSHLFPSYRRDGKCRGEIISAITILNQDYHHNI